MPNELLSMVKLHAQSKNQNGDLGEQAQPCQLSLMSWMQRKLLLTG